MPFRRGAARRSPVVRGTPQHGGRDKDGTPQSAFPTDLNTDAHPTNATLRVAHVVLSLDVGGLERLVVDLAREGARLGQRAAVVCLERPGTLADDAHAVGAEVYCVNKRPGLRPSIIGPLARLFRELKSDVVHTHQIGALLYAGPAARRAGIHAVIHTEHGKHYARRRTRWLGRIAGRYAQRFCCVSHDIAAAVRAMKVAPAAKLAVVPNGIDVERFGRVQGSGFRVQEREQGTGNREQGSDANVSASPPLRVSPSPATETAAAGGTPQRAFPTESPAPSPDSPAPPLTIGTIGRLNEIKQQDLLLRAFARLAAQRPDVRLLLVGEGPLRGELERLAVELRLGDRVHFAGYQPQPEQWLHKMDLFALTSRSEGMPLSILEAWAAGVPVVASAVGGVPELVEDGVTGRLFTSGDEAALAESMEALCADGPLRCRLAEAALARVRRDFSLTRMAADYDGEYRNLLSTRRARPPILGVACAL